MYPHFYLRLPQEAQLQGSIVFDRKKKGGRVMHKNPGKWHCPPGY